MKTLKKVLAVVLALAMVLGMAVTASAGFSDAEKITYKEAVSVMSLAGVLNGYPDGTFKPEGTLTRAEAAKMIVYTLGLEGTSLGYKANFGDISGHWAEEPISVAAGLGIVAGMGNGQFVPNGTLTGFQWAKIVLCAMGYDAEIEGMLGAGWEAKVADLMKKVDMDDDLKKFDGSKAVTREVAAQMLFNVVEEGFVGYPETGAKAVELGTKYYTGRNAVYGKADSFAARLKLTKGTAAADKIDNWGRPATTWYVNAGKKSEDSVKVLAAPEVVYTEAVTECDVIEDLGLDEDIKVKYYLNGVTKASSEWKLQADDEDGKIGAQGVLVEIYELADGTYRAVIVNTYLAKVTKVVAAKFDKNDHLKSKAEIYIDLNSTEGGAIKITSKKDFDYEKNDYVLVNINEADEDNSEILGLADSFEGVQKSTTKKYGQYVTRNIDGTEYDQAYTYGGFNAVANGKTTYEWFLDQYGNIIGSVAVETPYTYGVIKNLQWIPVAGEAGYAQATIVHMDGTETVEKLDDAKGSISVELANNYAKCGAPLYRFEETEDGLDGTGITACAQADVKTGVSTVSYGDGTFYVNSDTVFLVQKLSSKDKDTNGNKVVGSHTTYTSVTGYKNIGNYTGADVTAYPVDTDNDGYADYVYITGSADKDVAYSVFYVTDINYTVNYKSTGEIDNYTFQGYLDGVEKPLDVNYDVAQQLGRYPYVLYVVKVVDEVATMAQEFLTVGVGEALDIVDSTNQVVDGAYEDCYVYFYHGETAEYGSDVLELGNKHFNDINENSVVFGELAADMTDYRIYVIYGTDDEVVAIYVVDPATFAEESRVAPYKVTFHVDNATLSSVHTAEKTFSSVADPIEVFASEELVFKVEPVTNYKVTAVTVLDTDTTGAVAVALTGVNGVYTVPAAACNKTITITTELVDPKPYTIKVTGVTGKVDTTTIGADGYAVANGTYTVNLKASENKNYDVTLVHADGSVETLAQKAELYTMNGVNYTVVVNGESVVINAVPARVGLNF